MNAIILVAGFSSRFQELTKTTHKAMLKVCSVPNIERTIVYLKEAGINEIYIVVGYLKEQFKYLEKIWCAIDF
ncbi:NTP transferase domain-containing protein [Campylobacter volucris]|uniref:NTP transferase domain-containing protein n=1 Tax=Campylobacter volucris TaxID=1031542 RepID=UPI00164F8580|nr:NTP transferase domain-containing protein [Campylobacter volucris]